MMLPKVMEEALNDQVRHEFESAYAYLAMSAHCEYKDHPGFAHWLCVQAGEEVKHAMKFFTFITDRGGRVIIEALAKPPSEFGTLIELFEEVLRDEQKITADIHNLYTLAIQEKDYGSIPLLEWFISEQNEEEKQSAEKLALVRQAGDNAAAILQLDRQLDQRTK